MNNTSSVGIVLVILCFILAGNMKRNKGKPLHSYAARPTKKEDYYSGIISIVVQHAQHTYAHKALISSTMVYNCVLVVEWLISFNVREASSLTCNM